MKIPAFLLAILFFSIQVNAQFSDLLDPDFGVDGSKDHFFSLSLVPSKISVRNDNKILVMLEGTIGNGYLRVVLMNENGTGLESSFGISNSQSTFGSSFGSISQALRPSEMIVMPDNSIFIGGQITNSNPTRQDLFVMKLTPNGTLDPSFGVNGIVSKRYNEDIAVNLRAHGMAVGSDGSVYIAGSPQISNIYVTHFTAEGTPDLNYGDNGWATISQSNPTGGVTKCKLKLLSDGRLFAATVGEFNVGESFSEDYAPGYFCFLPNGTQDPTFNNGIRPIFQEYYLETTNIFSFSINYEKFTLGDVVIGPSDTIYITGSILDKDKSDNIDESTVLISLLPNGEYNPEVTWFASIDTFGGTNNSSIIGVERYALSSTDFDSGIKVLLDENNKIILVGYAQLNEAVNFIRYLNTNDTPIETFGENGLLTYNVFENQSTIFFLDAQLQSNGELICLSPAFNSNNIQGFNLVRFGEPGPLYISNENQRETSIFPNPASDYFRIDSADPINANIFDLSGKLVLQTKNQNTISIDDINAGIYLVELERNHIKSFHKLSVVR